MKKYFFHLKNMQNLNPSLVHKTQNSDLTHFLGEFGRSEICLEIKSRLRFFKYLKIWKNKTNKPRKNDDKITAQSLSFVHIKIETILQSLDLSVSWCGMRSKGQIISEQICGVLDFPNVQQNNARISALASKTGQIKKSWGTIPS